MSAGSTKAATNRPTSRARLIAIRVNANPAQRGALWRIAVRDFGPTEVTWQEAMSASDDSETWKAAHRGEVLLGSGCPRSDLPQERSAGRWSPLSRVRFAARAVRSTGWDRVRGRLALFIKD